MTDGHAYVASGQQGTRLLALDLRTRVVRVLGRIPPSPNGLVPGPEGQLAGQTYSDVRPPLLFRVRVDPFAVVTTRLVGPGDLAFVDRRRLVFLPSGGGRARVYTPALDVASSFAWTAYRSTAVGGTAWGVGFNGRLHRAGLPSGPERVIRRLPGPTVSLIVPAR